MTRQIQSTSAILKTPARQTAACVPMPNSAKGWRCHTLDAWHRLELICPRTRCACVPVCLGQHLAAPTFGAEADFGGPARQRRQSVKLELRRVRCNW